MPVDPVRHGGVIAAPRGTRGLQLPLRAAIRATAATHESKSAITVTSSGISNVIALNWRIGVQGTTSHYLRAPTPAIAVVSAEVGKTPRTGVQGSVAELGLQEGSISGAPSTIRICTTIRSVIPKGRRAPRSRRAGMPGKRAVVSATTLNEEDFHSLVNKTEHMLLKPTRQAPVAACHLLSQLKQPWYKVTPATLGAHA